jgi:uncharacterized membrane protein
MSRRCCSICSVFSGSQEDENEDRALHPFEPCTCRAGFCAVAAAYDRLPERVPTHWNAAGLVDAKMAKPWSPFVLPLTMAGVLALLLVLPHISLRNYEMEPFRRAFARIQLGILGFLFGMNVLVLLAGLGWAVPMERLLAVGIGALFVIIGNLMGKLTTEFLRGHPHALDIGRP